jgi:hypothetical protein
MEKNILKVVDYFNSYWTKLSRAKKYSSSTILWYNPDLDPWLNNLYALLTEFGDANIKTNPDLLNNTVWIDPIYCTRPWECGKKIVLDGKDIWLADLGNLLAWYNGAKIGFSYAHIEWGTYEVTWFAAWLWWKTEWALNNEISDRPFYRAWYDLASKKIITKKEIMDTLSVIYNSSEIYKYRKGW